MLLGMPTLKFINVHNLLYRLNFDIFPCPPFQSRRLVVMSRRRSQSVQKSQKWQSVRPNALDGLDGLLTTLDSAGYSSEIFQSVRRPSSAVEKAKSIIEIVLLDGQVTSQYLPLYSEPFQVPRLCFHSLVHSYVVLLTLLIILSFFRQIVIN